MKEFHITQGLVLALSRGVHHVELGLYLAAKGAKRIKIDVEGVQTHLTPYQAALVLVRMETDVRVLVSRGIGRLFPRPAGEVAEHVTINGRVIDHEQLVLWRAVWPSLEVHCSRPGLFFSDEPNSGLAN